MSKAIFSYFFILITGQVLWYIIKLFVNDLDDLISGLVIWVVSYGLVIWLYLIYHKVVENPLNGYLDKLQKRFNKPRIPQQDKESKPQQFESVPFEGSFLHQEEQRIEKEIKEQEDKFIDRFIMNTNTNTKGITNFYTQAKQAEIKYKEVFEKLEGKDRIQDMVFDDAPTDKP